MLKKPQTSNKEKTKNKHKKQKIPIFKKKTPHIFLELYLSAPLCHLWL